MSQYDEYYKDYQGGYPVEYNPPPIPYQGYPYYSPPPAPLNTTVSPQIFWWWFGFPWFWWRWWW